MKTVVSGQWSVVSGRTMRPCRFLFTVRCLLLSAFCLLPFVNATGAWVKQRSGSLAWLHAVYFLDEMRGWAVGGSGALLSTADGGNTWRALASPTEDSLQDVYFSDERNGWLVCERSAYALGASAGPRTYLLRTTDGGATWRQVNVTATGVNARLVRALFTKDGRGWVFGEAGTLYATRDGGLSWERQPVPTRYLLLGGSFISNVQGWLVGAGGTILQTFDGGETWRTNTLLVRADKSSAAPAAASSARTQPVRFNAVSFVDWLHGWAVGAGGRIFMTNDGGHNWREQESGVRADLLDVKFVNAVEGWAVGAEGTVIHTMDGGLRWVREPSGTTHPLERLCFVNRNQGWAVGFGGTIIAYAPANWSPQAPRMKKKD